MVKLHTAQELSRLRRRVSQPAFAASVAALRRRTDDFLDQDLAVPERSAGFYHDYFCPEHAVELTFDPASPTVHRCPSDGHLFSGEPFDSAWLWFVNNRLSTMSLSLALRWRIDGEPAHLLRAGEILTGYASRYGSYRPLKPREFGNGKATFQSLDEAVWLIPLARAYDLVRDSLSGSDRGEIEERLLIPAAEHILSQKYNRIHNIENWHNTAIAAVGLLLGEERFVRIAIEEENGFHHQLAEGVRDDGLWWEGSSGYHFYALTPMIALARICSGRGLELWRHERFERMFRAPVDLLLPGLRLPANNDCWFFCSLAADVCHGVPPAAAFYEIAHSWYGDPAFAWVLAQNYRHIARDSLEALLYGRDEVAPAPAPDLRSVNLEPTGCALLRSRGPLEEQDCLLLKYGPHGGGHGHPDKLGAFAFARGSDLSADLGTPGYGIELNDTWFRQTLSHNTVLVDGCSQPPAEGRLVRFESGERAFEVADAEVEFGEPPWEGVSLRRVILWMPGYYLDFTRVRCGRERQVDLPCRMRGGAFEARGLEPCPNPPRLQGAGYEHVGEAQRFAAPGMAELRWQQKAGSTALHLPGCGGTEIILGEVPGNPAADRSAIVIQRRQARETAFLSVVELSCDEPLEVSHWPGGAEGFRGVVVKRGARQRAWAICEPGCEPPPLPPGAAGAEIERYRL